MEIKSRADATKYLIAMVEEVFNNHISKEQFLDYFTTLKMIIEKGLIDESFSWSYLGVLQNSNVILMNVEDEEIINQKKQEIEEMVRVIVVKSLQKSSFDINVWFSTLKKEIYNNSFITYEEYKKHYDMFCILILAKFDTSTLVDIASVLFDVNILNPLDQQQIEEVQEIKANLYAVIESAKGSPSRK